MVVGAFYQMYFFLGRWAYYCGAYKWEGGLLEGGGGGWGYYCIYFFPGRWAYKFGAYEWQFMVIYVVV